MDREALIERVRKAAADILSGRGFLAAYAFGGQMAGSARPDSDLDIRYYLAPGEGDAALPLRDEMALASALSEEVGLEMDLRDLRSAPLELRGRVLEEGVRVFSGDPAARVALERDVIASEGYRFPKDNADSFSVLVEQGMVDRARLEALRAMACFRNRLVHLYWEVDDERVHSYLREGGAELARFAKVIAAHPWR